jgi:hypothetical protein
MNLGNIRKGMHLWHKTPECGRIRRVKITDYLGGGYVEGQYDNGECRECHYSELSPNDPVQPKLKVKVAKSGPKGGRPPAPRVPARLLELAAMTRQQRKEALRA